VWCRLTDNRRPVVQPILFHVQPILFHGITVSFSEMVVHKIIVQFMVCVHSKGWRTWSTDKYPPGVRQNSSVRSADL
jgi:hypothetical protein